jgi:hypothetical protein
MKTAIYIFRHSITFSLSFVGLLNLLLLPSIFPHEQRLKLDAVSLTGLDGFSDHYNRLKESYGKLPMNFEVKQGQADGNIKFLSRGSGYTTYFSPTEISILLSRPRKLDTEPQSPDFESSNTLLRMKFPGSNPAPKIVGLEQSPARSNYLLGNKPENWQVNLQSYARLKYKAVYTGVDVIYYGNQRQLEYDFIVAPEIDPGTISFTFDGAQEMRLSAEGDLILQTASGEVRQHKPTIYQEKAGLVQQIAGGYVVTDEDQKGSGSVIMIQARL